METQIMKTQIRVVSATVHNDTNEVEIIIEKTVEEGLGTAGTLHSLWIDCEDEIANSEA